MDGEWENRDSGGRQDGSSDSIPGFFSRADLPINNSQGGVRGRSFGEERERKTIGWVVSALPNYIAYNYYWLSRPLCMYSLCLLCLSVSLSLWVCVCLSVCIHTHIHNRCPCFPPSSTPSYYSTCITTHTDTHKHTSTHFEILGKKLPFYYCYKW